jgi:copper resistance protein C
MTTLRLGTTTLLAILWLSCTGTAWGHVFPDHQDPGAGSVHSTAPHMVRIWFDGQLEPVFSTIMVEDAEGHLIAKASADPDLPDHTLLQVQVPELSPGTYKVIWNVVARDGHRTAGQYEFSVRPSP